MTGHHRSSASVLADIDALRGILDAIPHPVFVKDEESRFLLMNETMCRLTGHSFEEIVGKKDEDFFPKDQAEIYRQNDLAVLRSGILNENEEPFRDGEGRDRTIVTQKKRLVLADGAKLLIGCITDISDFRRVEAIIRHQAAHDALTELPNRRVFGEAISEALANGRRFAVHYVDLDCFKGINDTLGHGVGDEVLRCASRRLVGCCRPCDMVARLGGDEFAVLQIDIDGPLEARSLASRIVLALAQPIEIDPHRIEVGGSVGVALAPTDGQDSETLLRKADLALYRAKGDGRNGYHFYERGMDTALQTRRSLEAGLKTALQHGELSLMYQPLVRLEDSRICAVEALLRWRHPEHGNVSPMVFLPIAEETRAIIPIGEWVLREACATAARWPETIRIAINLSPIQFESGHLVDHVRSALDQSGLAASRLELEITESTLLADSEKALETLHALRDLGVKIVMDDFGTGFSSLRYLQSFPFDRIKIDKSFIQAATTNKESSAIIAAVTGLGKSLGITTIAEGVETSAQLEFVRNQGCAEGQGFLFSRPLPAKAVGELIDRFTPRSDRNRVDSGQMSKTG